MYSEMTKEMLQTHKEKTEYCLDLIEQYKKKKGYKEHTSIHRHLERLIGIAEFHFYDAYGVKKEILTFSGYDSMVKPPLAKARSFLTKAFY
ncbi:hypothetical protein BB482_03975 [Helicobacter pylori]|uniref:hypothetical protein n=1 Tax=Helicobacter pylori TaxID=210 RepID=UPI000BEB45AA|nr:hypothetical protein [Helicobacter pylori]PDX52803.1 hypothetical protein BB482_03975 [Helicobacter pylori]